MRFGKSMSFPRETQDFAAPKSSIIENHERKKAGSGQIFSVALSSA